MTRGYKLGRQCGCGKVIVDKSTTGLCHPCFMREHLHKNADYGARGEKYRQKLRTDPAARARHLEAARKSAITRSRNLELHERLAKNMRENVQPLSVTPEALARRDRALNGRLSRAAKLAWCPPDLRDEYQALYRSKRMTAAQAREFVLAKAADREALRHLDEAARWLNRIAPVSRLADGTYRYGNGILRPAEVVSRAKLKGWQEAMAA